MKMSNISMRYKQTVITHEARPRWIKVDGLSRSLNMLARDFELRSLLDTLEDTKSVVIISKRELQ